MRTSHYILPFLLGIIFSACDDGTSSQNSWNKIPSVDKFELSTEETKANEGINQFGWELFSTLAENSTENVSVSPLSASICMAMAANSYDSDVENSVLDIMNQSSLSGMNSTLNKLMRYLSSPVNEGEVLIANSSWTNNLYTPAPEWSDKMRNIFYADLLSANFNDNSAKEAIDQWCLKNTHDLLLCSHLFYTPATVNILVNTLYFNGKWNKKFDKSHTTIESFHGAEASTKVDMMRQTGTFKYAEMPTYQTVLLMMGKYYLRLILPREDSDLSMLTKTLNPSSLLSYDSKEWIETKVDIRFPKFKILSSSSLSERLLELGLPRNGSFDRMGIDNHSELEVYQDYFLSIDEEGAEGASITYIVGDTSTGDSPLPLVQLVFNRPFIYSIENSVTGTPIFIGRIMDL